MFLIQTFPTSSSSPAHLTFTTDPLTRPASPKPRIPLQIPQDLYLVRLTFKDNPHVLDLCEKLDDLYAFRLLDYCLTEREIACGKILRRQLRNWIDPLQGSPSLRLCLHTSSIQGAPLPRRFIFVRSLGPSWESARLARELLGTTRREQLENENL